MTGYNLPPGLSSSDIPGNRPEDEIANQICDDCKYLVDDECPCEYDHTICPNDIDSKIQDVMCGRVDEAYDRMRDMEDQS